MLVNSENIKIAFRVDSGQAIGGGHLCRCITLANAVRREFNAQCYFVMRDHPGNQVSLIEQGGFDYVLLPLERPVDYFNGKYTDWVGTEWKQDAEQTEETLQNWSKLQSFDWLVVDHYGLDEKWERRFSKKGIKVGVIDDLVNRKHAGSFLVDQTCGRSPNEYRDLVTSSMSLLTGEKYCILRPEFTQYRDKALNARRQFTSLKNVLVNFGSTDPHNHTAKALKGIEQVLIQHNANATVIVGSSCPHLDAIKAVIKSLACSCELHVDVENMASLLVDIDVAVGAAGASTWERCILGIPTILLKTASNQKDVIQRVIETGAALEYKGEPDSPLLGVMLNSLLLEYSTISKAASSLVDGSGFTDVITQFALER